jgi:hypothetical protein
MVEDFSRAWEDGESRFPTRASSLLLKVPLSPSIEGTATLICQKSNSTKRKGEVALGG